MPCPRSRRAGSILGVRAWKFASGLRVSYRRVGLPSNASTAPKAVTFLPNLPQLEPRNLHFLIRSGCVCLGEAISGAGAPPGGHSRQGLHLLMGSHLASGPLSHQLGWARGWGGGHSTSRRLATMPRLRPALCPALREHRGGFRTAEDGRFTFTNMSLHPLSKNLQRTPLTPDIVLSTLHTLLGV